MAREPAEMTLEIPPETEHVPSVPLDEVLAAGAHGPDATATTRRSAGPWEDVVIGTLAGIDADGRPLVDFPGNALGRPLAARSTTTSAGGDVGRDVALMFEGADLHRPIVLGVIRDPQSVQDRVAEQEPQGEPNASLDAEVDGRRVVITAEREIVLRCGKASITLTRAGKVLIRGAYLLSRSSGTNRVKGGSVQIN